MAENFKDLAYSATRDVLQKKTFQSSEPAFYLNRDIQIK